MTARACSEVPKDLAGLATSQGKRIRVASLLTGVWAVSYTSRRETLTTGGTSPEGSARVYPRCSLNSRGTHRISAVALLPDCSYLDWPAGQSPPSWLGWEEGIAAFLGRGALSAATASQSGSASTMRPGRGPRRGLAPNSGAGFVANFRWLFSKVSG